MMRATAFLLVLSLALVVPGLSARELCVLTGSWVNDLGSNMTIGAVNKDGQFRGWYSTAVKDTPAELFTSPLVGYQHISIEPTFGFTVNWNFSADIDTVAVFTGQCFIDDGNELLKTTWLLRSHEKGTKDDWMATRVGTNSFIRLMSPYKSGY